MPHVFCPSPPRLRIKYIRTLELITFPGFPAHLVPQAASAAAFETPSPNRNGPRPPSGATPFCSKLTLVASAADQDDTPAAASHPFSSAHARARARAASHVVEEEQGPGTAAQCGGLPPLRHTQLGLPGADAAAASPLTRELAGYGVSSGLPRPSVGQLYGAVPQQLQLYGAALVLPRYSLEDLFADLGGPRAGVLPFPARN
jgi:hypothetical protein